MCHTCYQQAKHYEEETLVNAHIYEDMYILIPLTQYFCETFVTFVCTLNFVEDSNSHLSLRIPYNNHFIVLLH